MKNSLSITFLEKGNRMNEKKISKTYTEIIETEAKSTTLDFFLDKNKCLLFWDDITLCCQEHSDREINDSKRGTENTLLRNTLDNRKEVYFQIEGTDKFKLKPYSDKVISLSSLPQKLIGMIQKEVDRENKEGKDTMKHTLQKRVHIYNAMIQLVSADTIFTFPARSNDTKCGGILDLVKWRLSAILSAMKGGKTEKEFIYYMPKPEITECKKSFGKCTSLLKSGTV